LAFEVVYSLRARQEEIELLDYIIANFGKEKAKDVYDKIERVLEQIAEMPDMYRSSKKQKGLRKCVFSKQTSIYYRVQDNQIQVVSFRPNRKNPKTFKG